MRLAVWSGPRNLSTAMMYSFAQRRDFHVVDEPFYGPYLRLSGLEHPMRDDILQDRKEDAFSVEQSLLEPVPNGKAHVYHKHMCQHMIQGIPRSFMSRCRHVFLIRHPARVVASFAKTYPKVTAADIGFSAQMDLFEHVLGLGQNPIVIDSADVRENPEAALRGLCSELNLGWDPAMLRWSKGPKPFDGIWAPVWYASVHSSTGFAGPEGPMPVLEHGLARLVDAAMGPYEALRKHALRV